MPYAEKDLVVRASGFEFDGSFDRGSTIRLLVGDKVVPAERSEQALGE